jgi:hypothetical protein
MRLQDKLKQIKRVSSSAKTLDQLLPDADVADGRKEIAAAKRKGTMSLSFNDIGDRPPAACAQRKASHA